MAVDVAATVKGQDDFGKALARLDSRTARNGLQRALNQATQPVVKTARNNVDRAVGRDTGEGRKQIKKRNLKKAERASLKIDQGALVYLHTDGFYLMFWEFGFTRDGHSYAARPWMRPAIDSTKGDVVRRYNERASRIIEREAQKRR